MQTWTVEGDRRTKILEALSKSVWFKSLEAAEIASLLDLATLVEFENGETVLREGDVSETFFMQLRGVVTIEATSEKGAKELGRVRAPGRPSTSARSTCFSIGRARHRSWLKTR